MRAAHGRKTPQARGVQEEARLGKIGFCGKSSIAEHFGGWLLDRERRRQSARTCGSEALRIAY